ncbi:hypothetical protein BDV97DRAFT_399600 [Delphinella strobiligena]|nr:hypothetical protein BDV97DRAFT_399600 [Delphinella strobiligena]
MISRSFISRRAFASAPIRSFQTSRIVLAGKEDALHEEGRAEYADKVKHEQIQKQKEGKGEWHEDLASNSESIVKADKGHLDGGKDSVKALQDETAHLAEKKHKA